MFYVYPKICTDRLIRVGKVVCATNPFGAIDPITTELWRLPGVMILLSMGSRRLLGGNFEPARARIRIIFFIRKMWFFKRIVIN